MQKPALLSLLLLVNCGGGAGVKSNQAAGNAAPERKNTEKTSTEFRLTVKNSYFALNQQGYLVIAYGGNYLVMRVPPADAEEHGTEEFSERSIYGYRQTVSSLNETIGYAGVTLSRSKNRSIVAEILSFSRTFSGLCEPRGDHLQLYYFERIATYSTDLMPEENCSDIINAPGIERSLAEQLVLNVIMQSRYAQKIHEAPLSGSLYLSNEQFFRYRR